VVYGDKRRYNLQNKFDHGFHRVYIVDGADYDYYDRTDQYALHLPRDIREQHYGKQKAQKDRESAQKRYRMIVHTRLVLRHVNGTDMPRKGFYNRRRREADDERRKQRETD
jgi:hypothetical protein